MVRSLGIVPSSLIVTLSIELDDQPRLETGEVGDVRTDWILPPKHESIATAAPQQRPKQAFRLGGLLPETTTTTTSISHAQVVPTGRTPSETSCPSSRYPALAAVPEATTPIPGSLRVRDRPPGPRRGPVPRNAGDASDRATDITTGTSRSPPCGELSPKATEGSVVDSFTTRSNIAESGTDPLVRSADLSPARRGTA